MPESFATIADLEETERKIRASLAGIEGGVNQLAGWRKQMMADESFGRVFSGPQWLGGASIVDGTVDGNVFKANVTISSTFLTAESPADRWELDSSGLRFYGTVGAVQNTKIFDVNPTAGTLQLGTSGSNAITFAAGVLAIPAAAITSLTIAAVGTGTIGGTYSSSAGNPKMQISTSGIKAYNAGGTLTFDLDATAGDFDMIGTFTIASSAADANRISMTQAGIELWRGGVREFFLDSSGGASGAIQMLLTGPSVGNYIGMEPSTGKGLWLGASTFAAAPFSVSLAGIATMVGATIKSAASGARVELTGSGLIAYNSGGTQTVNISGSSSTITAATLRTAASGARVEMDSTGVYVIDSGGTTRANLLATGAGNLGIGATTAISWTAAGATTINASSITTGTLSGSLLGTGSVASGAIASIAADKITTGTITSQTITIGSGGKIIDGDGSYWDSTGIVLVSAGVYGDSLKWKVGGVDKGSIFSASTYTDIQHTSTGGYWEGTATISQIGVTSGPYFFVSTSSNTIVASLGDAAGSHKFIVRDSTTAAAMTVLSNGRLSVGNQTTRYISDANSRLTFTGQTDFASHTTGGSAANWSTFTSTDIPDKQAGWVLIYINNVACRIPFYANG